MQSLNSSRTDELMALLAVARTGTFSGAGRELLRHATIVSRRIAALEARLGVRLIERTTRQVRLTEAGLRLAARVLEASEVIKEAEMEASAGAAELRGKLRLAFPAALGRQWLARMLPVFLQSYPGLTVEVDYSERYVDLVADGFDAAVRVGVLSDSRLVARKLCGHRRILGASPAYIERHGLPRTPQQLADHNCLALPAFASFPEWRLSDGRCSETVIARGSLLANDGLALLDAARQGIGILGAGEWLLAGDFVRGTLIPVLPGWSFDATGGIYLVRPSAQFLPVRTQIFMDWLIERFEGGPPWSRSRQVPAGY